MSIRFGQSITLLIDYLNAVIKGDVDSDGDVDLIASKASGGQSSVSILLNDGEGAFTDLIEVPLRLGFPAAINAIDARDMNRDGKLDLVIASTPVSDPSASSSSASISVLLGNGRGGFRAAKAFNAQAALTSLIVADFNRDRYLDLAVSTAGNNPTDASGSKLFLLLGNGKGRFKHQRTLRLDSPVVAGDLNGDSNVDLAGGGITLLGNGKGQFRKVTYSAPDLRHNLIAGDFNNDRKLDLAAVGQVLLGDGLGKFLKAIPFSFIERHHEYSRELTTSVAAGDFNEDGKLDLIATDTNFEFDGVNHLRAEFSNQRILLGNGHGQLLAPALLGIGSQAQADMPVVADFNNDGKLDFVVLSKQNYSSDPNYQGLPQPNILKMRLNTGKGTDFIVFDHSLVDTSRESRGTLQVNLKTGQLKLGDLHKNVTGYRDVIGTLHGDLLVGNQNDNTLIGHNGGDVIHGWGGQDTLLGDSGSDVILGMGGDDLLTGGNGNDRLTGGKGQDHFMFEASSVERGQSFQSLGVDRITDFKHQIDKIDVSSSWNIRGLEFARTEAQAARSFSPLVYVQSTGVLYYNPNGRLPSFGAGGAFADLGDGTLLTAGDIV